MFVWKLDVCMETMFVWKLYNCMETICLYGNNVCMETRCLYGNEMFIWKVCMLCMETKYIFVWKNYKTELALVTYEY